MRTLARAGVVVLAFVGLTVPSSTLAADSGVLLVPGSGPGLTPATLAARYQAPAGPAGGRAGIAVVSASEPSLEIRVERGRRPGRSLKLACR